MKAERATSDNQTWFLRTMSGLEVTLSGDRWAYRDALKSVSIQFEKISRHLSGPLVDTYKQVLIWYLENNSPDYVIGVHQSFLRLIEFSFECRKNVDRIRAVDVLNLKDKIGKSRFAKLAALIRRWNTLGYEANPTKLYIRPEHEYLRSQEWISTNEIGQLVFESNPGQESIRQWLYLRGIPIVRRGSDYGVVKFADIEKTIVSLLPRNFPFIDKEIGLKYSNALCTFFRNTFHLSRCVYSCVVDVIEQNDVASRIGGERHRSIFHRFDFKEDDGSPIRLRSHQLRHYLNTLAQSGGLSQLDIAKWSGRRDIKQNNSYDHVSDRDVLAQVRAATPNSAAQLSVKPAVLARAKFQSLGISVAHTTEFGYCVHDFAMLPCQLHADCINCDEQVCVKGDMEREINVRLQLEETRSLLALAASASRQGDIGAARWQAHQQMTLERLEELCKLIDDPMIPVGSVIKLSPSNAQSRMKLAFSKRIELKEAAK